MTYLDVLALSEEVERDSQSGKLSSELLAQGRRDMATWQITQITLFEPRPTVKSHLATVKMANLLKSFVCFSTHNIFTAFCMVRSPNRRSLYP